MPSRRGAAQRVEAQKQGCRQEVQKRDENGRYGGFGYRWIADWKSV